MFNKIISNICSKATVNPTELALGCVQMVAQTVLLSEIGKYTQVVTNAIIDFDPARSLQISNKLQEQIDELKALNEKNESK